MSPRILCDGRAVLHVGDCLDALRDMPDNSVDSVVTDPPYGLSDHKPADVVACLTAWLAGEEYRPNKKGFMGRAWDSWVPGPEVWREVFRVLKPGGHVVAFAGSRTHDLMSMALRLAGFECRDTVMYLYGSGFPKSMNVAKQLARIPLEDTPEWVECQDDRDAWLAQWQGFGTSLKPAFEPALLFRKPLDGTVAKNVMKHGTGALNIDGCRIGNEERTYSPKGTSVSAAMIRVPEHRAGKAGDEVTVHGRFPSNIIHDGSPEVLAHFPDSDGAGPSLPRVKVTGYGGGIGSGVSAYTGGERIPYNAGSGSAARFFMQFQEKEDEWEDVELPSQSASTAEKSLSQQRQAAVSALAHAVSSALPEALRLQSLSVEPSTSATASELSLIASSVTQTIQSIGRRFWLASKPAKLSLSLSPVNVAVSLEPTGTTTITASHWKFDGSADPVTFGITRQNSEVGERGCGQSTAGRFIYCPKASKRDRNEGCERVETWGSADLSRLKMASNELQKAMCADTIPSTDDPEWSTSLFGSGTTGPLQTAIRSIIETALKTTTESKTSNCSRPWSTSVFIRAATAIARGNGLSLAELAESTSGLKQNTTDARMESVLRAVSALLRALSETSKSARLGNAHETVKPTDLMRYLCRLVTPPGGVVLDPFTGSGSTGKAAVLEGFSFIGCELSDEYANIAEARISHTYRGWQEDRRQGSLFGGKQEAALVGERIDAAIGGAKVKVEAP